MRDSGAEAQKASGGRGYVCAHLDNGRRVAAAVFEHIAEQLERELNILARGLLFQQRGNEDPRFVFGLDASKGQDVEDLRAFGMLDGAICPRDMDEREEVEDPSAVAIKAQRADALDERFIIGGERLAQLESNALFFGR